MFAHRVVRISKPIEIREVSESMTVANFGVAWNTGYGDKKKGHFIDCSAFNKNALHINEYFEVGSAIEILSGEIIEETWEKDGKNKRKHKLIINQWTFPPTVKETEPEAEGQKFEEVDDDEELPF